MSQPPYQRTGGSLPRPIRFVSSDGQPQTKRRRVIAACRTCRKRKSRCSGEQPVCKTCTDYGHTCLGYSEPATAQPAASSSSSSNTRPAATTLPAAQLDGKGKEPAEKPIGQREKKNEPEALGRSAPVPSTDAREQRQTAEATDQAQDTRREIRVEDIAPAISSPESTRSALISSHRTHVPYFRYFGPTAIVPGFKQMIVRVRGTRKSNPSLSNAPDSASSIQDPAASHAAGISRLGTGSSNSIHFYDPDDTLPNSEIVTHLCEVFFAHLGCNFPFLQRDRFLRSLKDKQLAPILVDAVCALAARFSLHPLLSVEPTDEAAYPHHGQAFAHRAMCAVVDALACPTLAVVQACLLLAYEEFGSNHDSGLWMYLGISIRMAQDLGIQKLDGMKFRYGCVGLTPRAVIAGQMVDPEASASASTERTDELYTKDSDAESLAAERAKEREKVDLFWSIFFLDRVISSGTGRPVTLRDDDIEIHFPLDSESILHNGWPSPYPPLMRIIHLYGRMTDILNSIKEVKHVTPDVLRRLAGMESDLTGIYQKLSPKLYFNVLNFQTYVKAGQGTNFILLHFWFHTLIVLLHQPTLLHSFSGKIQQLFSNSRELSMSSAKTIADILAFAELIDVKSFTGNPFTSQPIYIAACAFLMESAFYSLPSSRAESPPSKPGSSSQSSKPSGAEAERHTVPGRGSNPKHSLLAVAAKENYQRCYKALQSLEKSWAGTKYILTALDQKSKGIWDPLLYTEEEMESTADVDTSLTLAWKKRQAESANAQKSDSSTRTGSSQAPVPTVESTNIDPSRAIGWSLTGATNSSQPNLSFLYQLQTTSPDIPTPYPVTTQFQETFQRSPSSHIRSTSTATTQPAQPFHSHEASSQPRRTPQLSSPAQQNTLSPPYSHLQPDRQSPSNTTLNLTHSPGFTGQSTSLSRSQHSVSPGTQLAQDSNTQYSFHTPSPFGNQAMAALDNTHIPGYDNVPLNAQNLTIETRDIDVNTFQNQANFPFSFEGGFMPWLEYLPEDVLHFFGDPQG
ncbi:pathway-specific nitrogen regulator [Nannizzia gypsea CBS 118893]|uniref:Pathway-specific nitrogen regulator n=1 Tax=Arthroderma gypseum (strain ATCC MYA-4604 / CBS 118893) TaxID=535722 RepID=E4V1Y3_ARTGP|nr:pathway-specific nitrogen regulator [Nannizzia gypsea CBS 118893]EFR04048.1 pathway-specific nitrogen regulator [Nannizzia gypsea CBS 118893]